MQNHHLQICHLSFREHWKKYDLLILPADKGRAKVVLDKGDYDRKINGMLSDEKTYKRLDRDPVASVERKLNTLLLQLKKKGSISQDLYNRLRSSGGCTSLLYDLPKVHKSDVPLRPIVSFVSSPSHHFSKHMAKILSLTQILMSLTCQSLCPSLVPRPFNQIMFWSPLMWFLCS